MPTALSDEQQAFQEAIRDFCKRELGTPEQRAAATKEYTEMHSAELYSKLAELGWLGASIEESYGGSGGGMVDACIFLEETARGMLPMAGFPVSLIVAGAYERFGSPDQKQEILGGIVAGRVEAIAMSEPEAGSDVGALACRAEQSNGGYVLNGQKTWISAAHIADHILVVARTGRDGSKHDGVTMFSVPTDSEGVEIRGIQTMGGKEVNDVFLTDCHVDSERILGAVDGGWMQLMAGLNVERLITAATVLGLAERLRQGAQAVRAPDRQLPDDQASPRRPGDGAGVLPPAGLRHRADGRLRSQHDASPRGLDGKAEDHRDGEEGGPRGNADDGWLRVLLRVRHGEARADGAGLDDLRRHERDPA